jgi:hypothetical protein
LIEHEIGEKSKRERRRLSPQIMMWSFYWERNMNIWRIVGWNWKQRENGEWRSFIE